MTEVLTFLCGSESWFRNINSSKIQREEMEILNGFEGCKGLEIQI